MDYRTVFEISGAGMSLEKRRVEVAAMNLANMYSSVPAGQVGYQPQRVVAQPLTMSFGQAYEQFGASTVVPHSVSLETINAAPRLVRDPGHPHANAQGFVSYPAIDQASEMVSVTMALRAYEADVAVATSARQMASKALEIGGQG